MSSNDVKAIEQLVLREREGRDRGWWDEFENAYHPDAEVWVSWYHGNPAGFVAGTRKKASQSGQVLNPFVPHQLQPMTVRINGSRAVVILGCKIETQHILDGVEVNLCVFCHLVYRAEQHQGEWKLMSFNCIYERDLITPIIPGTSLTVDVAKLDSYRKAYRFLSYATDKMGRLCDQELPGEGN